MEYRGFVLDFYEFIPRIYAYNKNLDMSFGIGLTDIQKEVYNEMYGEQGWKTALINSVKRLINDYYIMKQEYKELLKKDLSARLPYGVKCKIALYKTAFNVLGIVEDKVKLDSPVYDEGDDWWEVTEVKPYLRPISSMTKEEREELSHYDNAIQRTDFFYSHHIDCRFIIEKGLALEAPEGMY